MPRYDLCLAWNWEYDADFACLLGEACARRGLTLLEVTPENLEVVLAEIGHGEVTFASFLDRASDADPAFQPLADRARRRDVFRLNPQELGQWADDKATMHLEFIEQGVHVPHSIVLPPYRKFPEPPFFDLAPLGERFAIKPAHGGGGEGVIIEASSMEQVLEARQQYPEEKYLLQAHLEPVRLDGRPAWFRVLYCAGTVYSCWWDQTTHVYAQTSEVEESTYRLQPLREVMLRIAPICRLDLFSSEIGLDEQGRFVVADYVNNPVDLRLQSKATDGVPDEIVTGIAQRLALLAEVYRSNEHPPATQGSDKRYIF
ncbi:MAG: hypothetical protein JXB85_17460 [Anaerolineales bacterium]|nr:hypothetical protein [Anaerolineales bacterium]